MSFLQKALKNPKNNLKRCLDRRRYLSRSGAAHSTLPTCKYFELMAFLRERSENKETDSNVSEVFQTQVVQNNPMCFDNQQSLFSTQGSGRQLLQQKQDNQAFSQDQVILQRPLAPTPSPGIAVTPSPSSSCGNGERCIETQPLLEIKRGTKRKAPSSSFSMNSDIMFLKEMKEFHSKIINRIEEQHKESAEICEDTLYCKSLIPILKGLPPKKKRLAKIKISSLLYDIEFGNVEDNA